MTDALGLLDQLRCTSAHRPIWIWGAGNQGRGIGSVLQKQGIALAGFIDQAADRMLSGILDLPVRSPSDLLNQVGDPASASVPFVIIASWFFESDIAKRLQQAGLTESEDFIGYAQLKPVDYSVDIAGVCNLKCLACPRGSDQRTDDKHGFMSLEIFRAVLDKILAESPFVGNLQLYQWGEPVLHPQLPDIIAYAHERGVRCAISSNLNADVDYARIIASRPEWLRISASGWGKDYEIAHHRGRWPRFLANLQEVARLRQALYPQMKIELYYHLYRHSLGENLDRFQSLCHDLDLEFHPIPAYLISLDDVLGYCEGQPVSGPASEALKHLLVSLDEGIAAAYQQRHLPCDVLRCVNINWDASVSQCMMYYQSHYNTVAPNYLEMSLEQIQSRRHASELCRRCTRFGLHQYCAAYAQMDVTNGCCST